MANIFISYRREDSAGFAGRLHDQLSDEFGRNHVFMDVDNIALGVNFSDALSQEVGKCDALLAVIGPRWLSAVDEAGERRLDDTNDFVRVEIAAALRRGVPVIPVLVEGARLPDAAALPEDLRELPLRNGLELHHSTFHSDVRVLVDGLQRNLTNSSTASAAERSVKPSAPRKAVNSKGKVSQSNELRLSAWERILVVLSTIVGSALVISVIPVPFILADLLATHSDEENLLTVIFSVLIFLIILWGNVWEFRNRKRRKLEGKSR